MLSSNLLNTIASTDPTFKDDLQEEQDILKKVIIDEKNGVENLANEQNLLIVAKENVDTIVDALKTDSDVQLALQDDVNNKLKMYGNRKPLKKLIPWFKELVPEEARVCER